MEKCMYDQWLDEELTDGSRFYVSLFYAFIVADGTNKAKLINAFPELFKDSEYI